MDCIVHRVAKSRTQLSDFHFHLNDSLELIIHLNDFTWRQKWDRSDFPAIICAGKQSHEIVVQHGWCESRLVVSNSLQPYGLYSPWNSQGQNTGVGSLSLLQGVFPTQGSKPGLPHCRRILYHLSHKGILLVHFISVFICIYQEFSSLLSFFPFLFYIQVAQG